MIPFFAGGAGVFALIQFIVSRKKFRTLRNFYLLSAVVSLGLLIMLIRMVLGAAGGLVAEWLPYFESETGGIICAVLLYAAYALGTAVFLLIFALITRHKSAYIGQITEAVSRIAKSGAELHIEEKGDDELAVLSRSINRMNADLQENRRKQQKAEQQKNELISNVSHDLRSPLTSILGYVQLLKEYRDRNDEKYAEYIEVTDRRLNGLNKLINELFELTRMDSPNFSLKTEKGDVTAFVRQYSYEMTALLEKNGLHLISDIDNAGFVTHADFERLARVMDNLFANVLKYARINTDVTLKSKVEGNAVSISLSNYLREGAEVHTEELFDRFYRDDQARTDADSAGLGLAIAKKIVELHGGNISAEAGSETITVTVGLSRMTPVDPAAADSFGG
jgi:Signal transduction histidine kinase